MIIMISMSSSALAGKADMGYKNVQMESIPESRADEEKEQVYLRYLSSVMIDSLQSFEEVDLADVTIAYDGEQMVFSAALSLNSSLSEEKLTAIKSRIKEAFTEFGLEDKNIKITTNL